MVYLTLEVDEEEAGQRAVPDPQTSRRSWRDWYAWAVVAAGTVFCLGPSLVGARTLISVDTLTNFLPWRANGFDALGHEGCTGDTVDSVMPGIAYFRGHLFSGKLPNWQNIVGGGAPLGSVPDLGLLNPLSLPYFILPLDLAPGFVVLLSWVAAIGGTYLFLRRFDISRLAASVAGFIFATSGFMVMWTNWPQTRVAALIPGLFWALERLIYRRKFLDLVLFAAILASMLLGGFPEVTGYSLYLAAGYLLVRIWILYRDSVRQAATVAGLALGGVVLGGALSAVQMLPFLKWYQVASLSYRSGDARLGLPNSSLFTLVSPNANGLCVAGKSAGVGTNPIESVAYIGAAALVLAVAGAAFGLARARSSNRGHTRILRRRGSGRSPARVGQPYGPVHHRFAAAVRQQLHRTDPIRTRVRAGCTGRHRTRLDHHLPVQTGTESHGGDALRRRPEGVDEELQASPGLGVGGLDRGGDRSPAGPARRQPGRVLRALPQKPGPDVLDPGAAAGGHARDPGPPSRRPGPDPAAGLHRHSDPGGGPRSPVLPRRTARGQPQELLSGHAHPHLLGLPPRP